MPPRAQRRPDAAPAPQAADRQQVEHILDGIRRIVRDLRVSSRAAEQQVGVSGAQLFVLQKLAQHPAESLNDLAERTLTHQSSVSVVVSRLVERGLVSRDSSIDDGRRITLSITAAGRALLRSAPEAAQARLIAAVSALPPRDLSALARGLGALVDALETSDAGVDDADAEPRRALSRVWRREVAPSRSRS